MIRKPKMKGSHYISDEDLKLVNSLDDEELNQFFYSPDDYCNHKNKSVSFIDAEEYQ